MLGDLVKVKWTDAHNNQGAWVYGEDGLKEFATDVRFNVTQVGYLVWQDDKCIVVASRLSNPEDIGDRAYGQLERIPNGMIESWETIDA